MDRFKIYEIGNTFARDTILENFILDRKKREVTKNKQLENC